MTSKKGSIYLDKDNDFPVIKLPMPIPDECPHIISTVSELCHFLAKNFDGETKIDIHGDMKLTPPEKPHNPVHVTTMDIINIKS